MGQCDSVLDVGCGTDSPVGRLTARLGRTVGVDGHAPSVEASRRRGMHSDYLVAGVLEIGEHFAERSFDCVVASDLIEHLEKADALRLLGLMERIARKKVIVFTPNGFLLQGEYGDNPFQRHRSGWGVEEMQALGYRVSGINGWRPLRGELARVAWRPRPFWKAVSFLSRPLTARFPRHAFQLLCVKDLA